MKSIQFFIAILLLLTSCAGKKQESKEVVKKDGTFSTEVILSAGELYPEFSKLGIPPFFNLGSVATLPTEEDTRIQTIILGAKLNKGKQVDVLPLGLMKFQKDSLDYNFLISAYSQGMDSSLGVDFNTFVSKNFELQMAIENWFKFQCSIGECSSFVWENEYKAIMKLQ